MTQSDSSTTSAELAKIRISLSALQGQQAELLHVQMQNLRLLSGCSYMIPTPMLAALDPNEMPFPRLSFGLDFPEPRRVGYCDSSTQTEEIIEPPVEEPADVIAPVAQVPAKRSKRGKRGGKKNREYASTTVVDFTVEKQFADARDDID